MFGGSPLRRDGSSASATNGSGYRSSAREREPAAAPSRPREREPGTAPSRPSPRQIFYIQVVRPDLRDVRLRSLLRRDGSSASATDGSGSFQFRAGARTGSRAVAGRAVAGADILHSGRSALSAGKRPQDARGRGRRCFTFPVVRRDLRDATPGRAMRLATPSRRKAAFSGALRRTR